MGEDGINSKRGKHGAVAPARNAAGDDVSQAPVASGAAGAARSEDGAPDRLADAAAADGLVDGLADAAADAGAPADAEPTADVEPPAGVASEPDGEDGLFASAAPTVRPATVKGYGSFPSSRHLGSSHGFEAPAAAGSPVVLGFSLRQVALIAAMAAAVAVVASLVVSCAAVGYLESTMDSRWSAYKQQMTDSFDEQAAQVSRLTDEYRQTVEDAQAAQETSDAVEQAKEDLRQTVADARAWLESGNGSWVSTQTKTSMNNAISMAQSLIAESGITDPQTYEDAADAINDIIDGVKKGTLY